MRKNLKWLKMYSGIALFLCLLFGFVYPAEANVVPKVDVNCERIYIEYVDFPSTPVNLLIEVTMKGGEGAVFSDNVATTGKEGSFNIPNIIPVNGDARLFVQWFVDGEHHIVQHFDVTCQPVETTTTTVPPTTTTNPPTTDTTVPVTVTSVPSTPPTTPPNDVPGEMPKTGGGIGWIGLTGLVALVAGTVIVVLKRRNERVA